MKEMEVRNRGFLLDLMGKDCTDTQQYRELLQNAFEAMVRHGLAPGTVQFDYDRAMYAKHKILKLCIIDTGIGMSQDELEQFINGLSVTGGVQGFNLNFGIGAKIAAATRNHEGLLVFSWRHGRKEGELGHMLHFARDPASGSYGLVPIGDRGDDNEFVVPCPDEYMPDAIKKSGHGTKIVLMGNSEDENTLEPPMRMPGGEGWLLRYLNTRYFHIPENIKVSVRTRYGAIRKDYESESKPIGTMQVVTGQQTFLNENSESYGTVILKDANAHWWIIKDGLLDEKRHKLNHNAKGHAAVLYQGEIYDNPTHDRTNRGRLQGFGITFGYSRVVIMIEPTRADAFPDTPRTVIKFNGEDAPWDAWQDEFYEKRPQEILDHVRASQSQGSHRSHRDAIRDRIKKIIDLFNVKRYRRSEDGKDRSSEESESKGRASGSGATSTPSPKPGPKPGPNSILTGFKDPKGGKAKKMNVDTLPDVKWISIYDGTRMEGELEDRAASYDRRANLIKANADFRVFQNMVEYCIRESGHGDEVVQTATDAVHHWFEQALTEAVFGSQQFMGSDLWAPEDIEALISEEALTAVVLQMTHIRDFVRRDIGSLAGAGKKAKKAKKAKAG
jgi:hypothetical protein